MKQKIYLLYVAFIVAALCFTTETKATIWYSDPTRTDLTIGVGTFPASGGGFGPSGGPYTTTTFAGGDDIVIQSGSTVTTTGAASIFCNNLTLSGTLVLTSGTAIIKFSGLFSGAGTLNGGFRLGTNNTAATISFNGTYGSTSGGITMNNNLTLAGNAKTGVLYFNTFGLTLNLAGYDITAYNVTGQFSSGGGGSAANYVYIKGSSASNMTLTSAGSLYFDQTTPGTTNTLASLTVNGGGNIYTPVLIYKYINHTSATSSFNINVTSFYRPVSASVAGTASAGAVTLVSNATATAYILCPSARVFLSGGAGTPTITIQQYLSAKRGYRLLGNPTGTAITLSTFATASNIDLNNGTNPTGATTTTAFAYDGTQVSPATPWVAAGATVAANKGLLLFVRGTTGQGIGGNRFSYTPDNVTLTTTGNLVKGTPAALALTYDAVNTNAQWNIIANPYPAPVSAKALTGLYNNSNINQSIYFVNPNKNGGAANVSNGDYDFVTLDATHDFIIPSFGAIFVQAQAAAQTVQFTEAAKSTTANTSLFGNSDAIRLFTEIELVNTATNMVVDKVQLMQDNNSSIKTNDHWDLPKLSLGGEKIYSYATINNNVQLAVDARKDFLQDSVVLGVNITQGNTYKFKVSSYNLPLNVSLALKDNVTGTVTTLQPDIEYSFSAPAGSGLVDVKNRFVVLGQEKTIATSDIISVTGLKVYPNPSTSLFVIDWRNAPQCYTTKTITITNAVGKVVKQFTDLSNIYSTNISLHELPTGLYYLSMVSADGKTITVKSVQKN